MARKFTVLVSVLIFPILAFATSALAMSVVLDDGERCRADSTSIENVIKVRTADGKEKNVGLSQIKTIDFSDETSETKTASATTSSVEIPPDVKHILSLVPDKSKFPNAGGYVIEDEDIYTLNADGTNKVRSHYIFKIFEDRAVNPGLNLGYAFERESAKIIMARTIAEDGKVYNLNPRDIKDGDSFSGASMISHTYKYITATLPNVKKGSIIEYVIEQNTFKPIIEGYFTPGFYLVGQEPKRHVKVEIHAPKGKKLYYVAKNFDRFYDKAFEILKPLEKPVIHEDSNEVVYSFEAFNVPELISEPDMPNAKDIIPRVQFSAFETWDKIYDWDSDKLGTHVNDISEEMKKKVGELTKDCRTNDEKVAKIYHYVQQEIRYVSIKGDTLAGRAGHPAKETFEKKYGDCTDKSILMSAMLKIVGIDCYPSALKAGGGQLDSDIAAIDTNHKICFLKYDSKEIFLDSTSQDSRFPFFRLDDHDRNNLVSQLRRIIKAGMPVSNQKSVRDVELRPDGSVYIRGRREFDGAFESSIRARNKRLKEEQIKDDFRRRLSAILPGVKLHSLKYTDLMNLSLPVVEEVEYEAADAAIIADDLMLFSVPGYTFNFSEVSTKERKFPIDYEYLSNIESVFNFKLPAGYTVKYLPAPLTVENKYILFKGEYKETAPGVITFSDKIERKARFVDPADYASYKADLEKLMKYAGEKVVIRRENVNKK